MNGTAAPHERKYTMKSVANVPVGTKVVNEAVIKHFCLTLTLTLELSKLPKLLLLV